MRVKLKTGLEVSVLPDTMLETILGRFGMDQCQAILTKHFQKLAEKELREMEAAGMDQASLETTAKSWMPGDAAKFKRLQKALAKLTPEERIALTKRIK